MKKNQLKIQFLNKNKINQEKKNKTQKKKNNLIIAHKAFYLNQNH